MAPELTKDGFRDYVMLQCGAVINLTYDHALKVFPNLSRKSLFNARSKGDLLLQGERAGLFDWTSFYNFGVKVGYIPKD